jgi:hypothetical protein
MTERPVTAEEFRKRLVQLCLKANSMELPGRQRDRQIILKSIVLHLPKEKTYSERELNAALMSWVGAVGHTLEPDHAALRRALIDEKYLERSADGTAYHLAASAGAGWFAPEVDALNPSQIVEDAVLEAAAKREQFRNRPSG